jgi:endonuclease/exonuclease/phosphatase family metal-dependent hydrolase
MLLCYSAAYVSPDSIFWWLQLVGMAYGTLLFINLGFMILWILLRDRRFIWSFLIILIGYGRIFSTYEPGVFTPRFTDEDRGFTVMSYNVRLFDLYNWFHNDQTRKKILNFLDEASPDVVCFQEYFHSDGKANPANTKAVHEVIPAKYSHIEYSKTLHNHDHWGMATFSKFPIVNKQRMEFKNNRFGNLFTLTDIKVNTDTFRIINTHLESIHFGAEDYKYLEKIQTDVNREDLAGGLRILNSIRKAYKYRTQQVMTIETAIDESPYPVILCGDFNDPPSSFAYRQISGSLKDAFRESGSGSGNTYVGPFPSFRIDYILYDERLESSAYTTHKVKLSDHFAVSTRIRKRSD